MSLNVHSLYCNTDPVAPPDHINQHWTNTVTGDIWLSNGTASINNWIKITTDLNTEQTITASSANDLDINTLNSLCAVEYTVCMFNVTENKWATFKMLATKKTDSSVEDTVYARIGSLIDVDFDFNIDGTEAKLVGTNNETFDVSVRIHKTLL